jgi:hypothetical protein
LSSNELFSNNKEKINDGLTDGGKTVQTVIREDTNLSPRSFQTG